MTAIKQNAQEMTSQFCQLSMIIAKYQNQLQAIRQALTLRHDFHPEVLFSHISMGETEITKMQLICLMEENNRSLRQQETRLIFSLYGYKDKLSYSDFLNYIYPYDTEAIKTISTVLSKKYAKIENPVIQQQILALFIILIEKEIEFMHDFEDCKAYLIPQASREYIKKMIKHLKKGNSGSMKGIQSDYVLTFQEFKGIVKKQKNINERKAQPICRRLSLQKHAFIGLDQLEIWFKPWPKLKSDDIGSAQRHVLTQEMQGCSLKKIQPQIQA